MRRGLGLALAGVLCLTASVARANPNQESVFEDDDQLVYQAPATVDANMQTLHDLGVDRVRLPALWRALAPATKPADPANPDDYSAANFAPLDHAVASAYAHGLSVLLNVRGGAPDWAQGSKRPKSIRGDGDYRPSAKQFGLFMTMLGRRYDGSYRSSSGQVEPIVDAWSLWNEPNWPTLLAPQSSAKGAAIAPNLYRKLYRSGSAALRATGHASNVILMGETAPLGSSRPGPMRPMAAGRFYRGVFCLKRNLHPKRHCGDFKKAGPLISTGIAHHPYPVKAPPERRSKNHNAIRLADGHRLERILDAAKRYHRVNGHLPIWYTEFGYQTKPPDPYRGISLKRQAAWLVRGERIAYLDHRVLSFDQFELNDTPPQTQYPASDRRYWSTYQTGLRFANGREKPSFAAYRLPFVRPSRHSLWGMVRPGLNGVVQTVRVEHRAHGAWAAVGTYSVTNPRGYFTVRLRHPRSGPYRFVWLSDHGEVASRAAVSG